MNYNYHRVACHYLIKLNRKLLHSLTTITLTKKLTETFWNCGLKLSCAWSFPVLRGAQQLQLCCCQYVSIIYSLKLYCFRLVPLIYDVMMWALNMQDWLYFFWAYWASWVWAGHEDTNTWHEDTNLCRTCDILTRSLVCRWYNLETRNKDFHELFSLFSSKIKL